MEPAIEVVLKSPITSLFKYDFRSRKLEFDDDESIDANDNGLMCSRQTHNGTGKLNNMRNHNENTAAPLKLMDSRFASKDGQLASSHFEFERYRFRVYWVLMQHTTHPIYVFLRFQFHVRKSPLVSIQKKSVLDSFDGISPIFQVRIDMNRFYRTVSCDLCELVEIS